MKIENSDFFRALIQQPCIEKIWLFGSRARGDHQEKADIDLAIECPAATTEDWIRIQNILAEANTLLKIDCVRLDTLSNSSALKMAILEQGIKLYDQPL